MTNASPAARRLLIPATLALPLLVVGFPTSAAAHVEVEAIGDAQAGTGPVTLRFMAESESQSAGIVGIKTQLPTGIAPADVTLVSGPDGWTLTTTDDGFELGGPDVGPGIDVEYSVTVAALPDEGTELPFKTLQFYADGREDAWIELPTESNPEPDMAAPVLTVAPAPATSAPTSSTPTTAPSSSTSAAASPTGTADAADDGSGTATVALTIGTLAVLALGAGAWLWRSRRSDGPS